MSATPLPSDERRPPLDAEPGHHGALHDEVAHLHEAMKSQRDIGMAVGLVSARFRCSTEQAWRTLLRISQDSNTKIRTVAQVLVATHNGTDGPEDRTLLASFVHHLPASGWPRPQPTGDDPVS